MTRLGIHHINGPSCPLCLEKIDTLDERIKIWALWMKARFEDAHISWGFRGKVDQDAFFAAGKSKARWPGSKHNAMTHGRPAALAFDVFQIRAKDGVAYFGAAFCEKIAKEFKEISAPIEWSGSWKGFREQCHFQLDEKTSTKLAPGA